MRALTLTLALLLLPLAAAAECEALSESCPDAAAVCCPPTIEIICTTVEYTPRCDWSEHQCATPLTAGGCTPCIEPPCHQQLLPLQSRTCYFVEPPCHKPVVAVTPVDPCPAELSLNGGKHLLTEPSCSTECLE